MRQNFTAPNKPMSIILAFQYEKNRNIIYPSSGTRATLFPQQIQTEQASFCFLKLVETNVVFEKDGRSFELHRNFEMDGVVRVLNL